MIKFLKITFLFFFLISSALAGSDGKLELSKKNDSTKDCFETLNRTTFKLNQGLEKAILKCWDNALQRAVFPLLSGPVIMILCIFSHYSKPIKVAKNSNYSIGYK